MEKAFGVVLILVAVIVGFDTGLDLWREEFSWRNVLILAVALFIALRGVLRLVKHN